MTNWQKWFDEAVSESGDSIAASRYDSQRSFYVQQQAVLGTLGELRGKTILDVGPGTGHFSQPLTRHNQVLGIDFVPGMLHYAANKGLQVVQGDGSRLPLPSESIDVVICVGVLQHIDDASAFMRELLRVRKPNGQIFLTTLNKQSWVRWLYYKLTRQQEIMHTYTLADLTARFQQFAPNAKVDAATIYYPFPGYRWVGKNPLVSQFLSTAIVIRVY